MARDGRYDVLFEPVQVCPRCVLGAAVVGAQDKHRGSGQVRLSSSIGVTRSARKRSATTFGARSLTSRLRVKRW